MTAKSALVCSVCRRRISDHDFAALSGCAPRQMREDAERVYERTKDYDGIVARRRFLERGLGMAPLQPHGIGL